MFNSVRQDRNMFIVSSRLLTVDFHAHIVVPKTYVGERVVLGAAALLAM